MYENQTFETILSRMLNNISDEIDKREGSVARDMLSPKAIELAMAYMEMDNVINFGFAGTTYGEFLDLKVAEVGLTRQPAQKSKGILKLINTSEDPIYIVKGTVAYTNSGVQFQIDEDIEVGSEPLYVGITASEFGVIGNVPINSITNIEVTDIQCTNEQVTSGGVDVESDEKLLERYYIKVRSTGVSGNKYQYRQWATEIAGIGDAKVIPTWNGPNSVKIILIDTNKDPVNENKIQEVYDYIESERPIGAEVTIITATHKTIDISAVVTLQGEADITDVTNRISNSISQYFKEATFVDEDIKYSRIGNIIFTTEGVVDYSNLLLNGSTDNILLGDEDIPYLGQVTLT